eukprot:gene22238-26817_t
MYAIDYSTLSHEQRLFAKAAGVPVHLLYNALNASEIISREDLAHFSLHSVDPLHWKLFSRGSLDIPATYGSLYTCLTGFEKKLVVFRTHESQAVAVYFPHRCDGPGEHACTGTEQLVAYVFARGFRKKEVLVDHQFDFDSVRLQLYRGQKRSSF